MSDTRTRVREIRMAIKSWVRSRFQPPVIETSWLFPGQKVIPIFPPGAGVCTQSMRSGSLMLDRSITSYGNSLGTIESAADSIVDVILLTREI